MFSITDKTMMSTGPWDARCVLSVMLLVIAGPLLSAGAVAGPLAQDGFGQSQPVMTFAGAGLSESVEDQALVALAKSPLLRRLAQQTAEPVRTAEAQEPRVLRAAGSGGGQVRSWGLAVLVMALGTSVLRVAWSL